MENHTHSEIFFDNIKKKNYTHESLLRGILYHTEFKKDMSSIGLDDTFSFDNDWSVPLNVAYIINPVRQKSFINFTTSFAF